MAWALADGEFSILVFLVLVPLGILSLVFEFVKPSKMLDTWARKNGFRLLEKRYRWIFKGPYSRRSGRNHAVYRISVLDGRGQVRRGWARCGGWFTGMGSNQVDVRWDDQLNHQPGFPVILPGSPTEPRT